jgi:hypothetical protein
MATKKKPIGTLQDEKKKVSPTPKVTDFIVPIEVNTPDNQPQNITEQYKEKMVDEVYSKEDVELKTRLNQAEIIAIAKGQVYADVFKAPIIADLCNKIMILKISKDGLGRKEFVDIAKSMMAPQPEMMQAQTIPERLLGKGI